MIQSCSVLHQNQGISKHVPWKAAFNWSHKYSFRKTVIQPLNHNEKNWCREVSITCWTQHEKSIKQFSKVWNMCVYGLKDCLNTFCMSPVHSTLSYPILPWCIPSCKNREVGGKWSVQLLLQNQVLVLNTVSDLCFSHLI